MLMLHCRCHTISACIARHVYRHLKASHNRFGGGGHNERLVPPPLAQARPRSQKSGQNGGSTPTPCLDKAVHARDTCDSQTGNNIVSHD